MTKPINVEDLVASVCTPRGCKVSFIKDPQAIEFINKVTAQKQAGQKPNIERTSELLTEVWGIDIDRRALSEHVRGKCKTCRKKKTN